MDQGPEHRLAGLLAGRADVSLSLAESCTGGMIAQLITSVPGSSAYFDRGLVVYSNAAKAELLGVDPALPEREGAVSRAVAVAMLEGLFGRHRATLGAAVTGIAGPEGGSPEKPVGTVWIAWGTPERRHSELLNLSGGRDDIRREASRIVLTRLCQAAERSSRPCARS